MKTTMSFISIVIISIMLTSHTIPVTVTGTVTDAAGNPLSGVLVKAKPGSATAFTGNNGFYRITPDDKSLTLVFSLQGYTTVTEKIAAPCRTTGKRLPTRWLRSRSRGRSPLRIDRRRRIDRTSPHGVTR